MTVTQELPMTKIMTFVFAIWLFYGFLLQNQSVPNTQDPHTLTDTTKTEQMVRIFKRKSALSNKEFNLTKKNVPIQKKRSFSSQKFVKVQQALGWGKQSEMSNRTAQVDLKQPVLPTSRSPQKTQTADIGERKFLVSNTNGLKISTAPGFSNTVETPPYRGRLPLEAVQALEEIKERQLTIEEVRALLNKHTRPK